MEVLNSLQYTPLLSLLGKDVLQLAITGKATFQAASNFINNNILFRYPGESRAFHWYHPQRLRIGGLFGGVPVKRVLYNDENKMQILLPPLHYALQWSLLPPTLTHLTFGIHFNSPVDNLLPHTLTHLSFEDGLFNHPVDHLPPALTHLTLSLHFNHPVNHLPASLSHLTLSKLFYQAVNNLPHSLTYLSLCGFVRPLISLPASLQYLRITNVNFGATAFSLDRLSNLTTFICSSFPRDLVIPASVLDLQVDRKLDSTPPNLKHLRSSHTKPPPLPSSLLTLTMRNTGRSYSLPTLPPNLTHLTLRGGITPHILPSSLVTLDLHMLVPICSAELIRHVLTLPNLTSLQLSSGDLEMEANNQQPVLLPPKLSLLGMWSDEIGDSFVEFINSIDFSSAPLTTLSIHRYKPGPTLPCPCPPSLTSLEASNISFQGELPHTLQKLSFQMKYMLRSFTLPPLPDSLTELKCLNCHLPPSYPRNLEVLDVTAFQGQKITALPSGLKTLKLQDFQQELPELPSSLRQLHAPESFIACGAFIPPLLENVTVRHSKWLPAGFPTTLEYFVLAGAPQY